MRTTITDLTGELVSFRGRPTLSVKEDGELRYYRLSDLLNVCFHSVQRLVHAVLHIAKRDILTIAHETDSRVLESQILDALDRAHINFNEQLRVRWIGIN